MKRRHLTILGILVLCAWSVFWITRSSGPLDLSNDEEPFRSLVLPPKSVRGDTYMDGGSVMIEVIDKTDTRYEITFPIDRDGIRNAHNTAFFGNINDPKMVPLKDPARAREIAIRLLRDHGVREIHPAVDSEYSGTDIALRALSNPPRSIAARAIQRVRNFF